MQHDPANGVDQPGLRELREAVANHLRRLPGRRSLRQDAVAGLNGAINNVSDGMANAALVGVNPLYGLYATMIGPIIGGLFSSTQLMMITTTAAASLTASQALTGIDPAARENSLFVLVVITGIFQLMAGMLGFGRLARFVSYSVITGLLAGISVLLIISQIPTITGYRPQATTKIVQAFEVLENARSLDRWPLVVGLVALGLALFLPRTPLGNLGRLLAIVLPSMAVAFGGLSSVPTVRSAGEIGGGVPEPSLPSFVAAFNLLTGALSLTLVTLVQGIGVSQTLTNPDGASTSASRDFVANGCANVVSGLFRGLPVGGSVSSTALNVVSGAMTRWSTIFAGLWMAIIVVTIPRLVGYIAIPALAALLILAGARGLKPADLQSIWQAGWRSRLAASTTFLAAILLPIQAAVGIGVVLAAILYVNDASTDIKLVELTQRPDGRIEERRPPPSLRSNEVMVLDVYGQLFYAGARTLGNLLPTARGTERPVVILRMRGRKSFGATLVEVLSGYARQIGAAGGRLYVTGLSDEAHEEASRSRKLMFSGPVEVYRGTAILGESTRKALDSAEGWLVQTDSSAETSSR
ncbi:MAG TPA: SulP family inorganic anion transporter [Thermoanaerobaculia bacterium]|nr:SulP family inorganic anion transporter [Thermoanaerobaculia bacterium]